MQTHGTGEGKGKHTVSVDMQIKKKYFRPVDQSEQLFPRLPNEITLYRIVPKLPWRAFHVLAAVSSAWRQAIQDHRVHDARIHSCSTDPLVVHGHDYRKDDDDQDVLISDIARIAVYSVREKLCYDLPPIPGHYKGVPSSCQCVSLDGKIYIIGGAVEVCNHDGSSRRCGFDSSSKVYVLDLAGASHWKECASMERGRQRFGCGVIEGKIYVFGGSHSIGPDSVGPVRGAEVYNPKVNAWTPITPMASLRFDLKVLTRGEKIVVHGGDCYAPSYTCWRANRGRNPSVDEWSATSFLVGDVRFTEVYHPVEDRWTVEGPLGHIDFTGGVFVDKGKFHLLTVNNIYVQDEDAESGIRRWKHIRNSSLPRLSPIGPDGGDLRFSIATVLLIDELLVGVEWHDESDPSIHGSALLQSKGFGTENDIIVWKVLSKCPRAFGDVISCIQL